MAKHDSRKTEIFDISKISLNELILLSLFLLKKEVIFEELLEEAFLLAPRIIAFSKNPHWPDARKIDRPLRFLKNQGLIKPDAQKTFSLTRKGEKLASQIAKGLRQEKFTF